MKRYVLGFAFDEKRSNVVLIEKNRPEWQAGFLNGVGGKVEESDRNVYNCMGREFFEETGVFDTSGKWRMFANMTFKNDVMGGVAEVYCFKMFTDEIFQCKTMESEEVKIVSVADVSNLKIINHLKTLIPMALDDSINYVQLDMK